MRELALLSTKHLVGAMETVQSRRRPSLAVAASLRLEVPLTECLGTSPLMASLE